MEKMPKRWLWMLSIASVIGFFGAAYAEFATPEDAITYRKSVMTVIGHQFKKLAAVVKNEQPYDAAQFSKDAKVFQTLVDLPWEAFMVSGSDKGNTTMHARVLQEPDAFKAEAAQFVTATGNLAKAADAGDSDALREPFGATAKSCKTCHDRYRK